MPNTTPTEEQQITFIRKRWRKYALRTLLLYWSILFIFIYIPNVTVRSVLFYVGISIGFHLFVHWASRRFVHQLPPEERELIIEASRNAEKRIVADALLNACKAAAPQKEYLRPSQQTQDDTLLRAAQYTDEKAQDQLLRSTDYPHSTV